MAHLGVGGPLNARGLGADGEKGQAGADAAVAHDGGDVAVLLRQQTAVRNEWLSTLLLYCCVLFHNLDGIQLLGKSDLLWRWLYHT